MRTGITGLMGDHSTESLTVGTHRHTLLTKALGNGGGDATESDEGIWSESAAGVELCGESDRRSRSLICLPCIFINGPIHDPISY